jgi:glycosyltransferase involved in cell wall biosynthesis
MGKSRRRLLLLSYAFAPSIGGIETVSDELARVFSRRGYAVTVLTATPYMGEEQDQPFRVLRRPGMMELVREIGRADLVLQSNMSLRIAWPLWLLFPRKPFIVVHHTTLSRSEGRLIWKDRIKRCLLWRPYCLSVSNFLTSTIQAPSYIIRNPYANTVFRIMPEIERNKDLLFVGRLVTAKGVDTLLAAFPAVLKHRPQSTLSIVGTGIEEDALRNLASSLGIEKSVFFLGPKQGAELAKLMNQHRILVVPSRSRPPEALSVVVIEGIACGCVPVASRLGGLPEAVGDAGVLYEEGNRAELADILIRLLTTHQLLDFYRSKANQHLIHFEPDAVADAYEFHFNSCSHGELRPA